MNSFRSFAGLLGWTASTSGLKATNATGRRSLCSKPLFFEAVRLAASAGGRGQQRVAVRRRAGHRLRRDVAAGAAAVLHHEALLEAVGELGRDQPPDDVGEAAGRERHDHGDVLRRIGLRRGRLRESRQRPRRRSAAHAVVPKRIMAISLARVAATLVRRRIASGQCDALDQRSPPATGAHSTCSIRVAPVASITRRSKPSAMPLAGGMAASAARKSGSIG